MQDCAPAFQQDWRNAVKDKVIVKSDFFELAGEKQGNDLLKLMEGTLIHKLTTTQEVELEGTGEWKTETELDDDFKNQPERLAAVKRNTTRWWDSTGEVELLEVMRYKTKVATRTRRELEESWQSTVHDRVKKVPRPKAEAKAKAKAEAGGVVLGDGSSAMGDQEQEQEQDEPKAKKLKPSHETWIEKQLMPISIVTDLEEAMFEFKNQSNLSWSKFIPDHVSMRSQASLVKFESQIDKLKAIKEAGEVVDFKAVQTEFKACLTEVSENRRKAHVQWEEAWSMLSQDEQDALLTVSGEEAEAVAPGA